MTEEPKDKQERKLKKVKISLMRNPLFVQWSGVMMVGKTEVVDNCPSACTNGRDEMYGRKFIRELDEKELAFVVLHENLHKAFKHLFIWRKLFDKNPRLTNMACDYVINLMLVRFDPNEVHIAVPKKDGKVYGLLDTRFAGMNTKQVFDILEKEQKEGGEGGEGEPGDGEGEGNGHGGFDEHDWDGAKELTPQEQRQLEREIDQGLRQGQFAAKRMGAGSGDADRLVDELLKPQVNWKDELRDFVKSICTGRDASSWRRVNRRFLAQDIYMPTLVSEKIGKGVVGIDTSGSISGKGIALAVTEIDSLMREVKPEGVDLLYWDHSVARHEEYGANDMEGFAASTRPKGGGGTDPQCVSKFIQEK